MGVIPRLKFDLSFGVVAFMFLRWLKKGFPYGLSDNTSLVVSFVGTKLSYLGFFVYSKRSRFWLRGESFRKLDAENV